MRWKTTIKKEMRDLITTSKGDKESVIKIADRAILELERLKGFAGNDDCLIDMIEESIEHFSFMKELADGTIPESNWDEFEFDGEFENIGNYYLSEFFDVLDYELEPGCKLCFLKF